MSFPQAESRVSIILLRPSPGRIPKHDTASGHSRCDPSSLPVTFPLSVQFKGAYVKAFRQDGFMQEI